MRRFSPLLAAAALLATVFVAGPAQSAFASCSSPTPAPLAFQKPVFIDETRDGGEPTSVVANDGTIVVGAHLGTTLINPKTVPDPNWLANYRNQTLVWRSADDGKTWQHVEIAPGTNMHSALSTGFSDPDFAKDSAGNLYGTEIDLANVAVFSSHDNGATWPQADAIADSGDRPWLAARGNGVVYERITGNLQKSTDGGQTWTALHDDPSGYGQLMTDPTDPRGLFMPLRPSSGAGVDVSRDDGQTWTTYQIPGTKGQPHTAITAVGVDAQGWVYQGYLQGSNVLFSAWNPATQQWAAPTTVATVDKSVPLMWPWTVAGDAGRVAVGWYELDPVTGQAGTYDVHVKVAVTQNGRGSTITCPDGTTQQIGPQFSSADAMGRPIYTGAIPCTGTGCNATGDRRLGDFFTLNFDRAGRVFVTTGDTTLTGPGGQVDTSSHPLFSIATDGSPTLLAKAAEYPAPTLLRDAEAGRSALVPPSNNRCSDKGNPSQGCEQPDTTIEPSVAVNPENPQNAVAAYQENRVDGGGDGDNGYATTFDGGRTWTYGNLPGLTRDVGGDFDRASDAVVAFGPNNVVYANSLVFDDRTGNGLRSGIVNNVSTDGGKTWGPPLTVQDDQGAGLNDKNWIVVDTGKGAGHHFGRVYVVWDRVAGVFYRYSDDQGQTWSQLGLVYPAQGIGAYPMVMPNGDLAVVFDTLAYPLPQLSGNPDEIQGELFDASDKLVVSVARGAGTVPTGSPLAFAPPTTVATYDGNNVQDQRAAGLPAATEDPVTGRIYVTWETGRFRTDDRNDVVVTASDDEGATWGPIVKVNQGAKDDDTDHYNPTVAVDTDGVVRIAYRERAGNGPIDTVYQESHDNGLHFSAPLVVNTIRSDPTWGAFSRGGLFEGDYNQLATAGGFTYIVRCEAYNPALVAGDPVVSHRYHQTTWVAVVQ